MVLLRIGDLSVDEDDVSLVFGDFFEIGVVVLIRTGDDTALLADDGALEDSLSGGVIPSNI